MNEAINFELVSPEARLVSEPVKLAVIPGEEGEMGVGAGHAAYVVALKAGVVSLYQESEGKNATRRIFIAGGFADITGENCTILAEEAVNVNELDEAALRQELANLKEDLSVADSDIVKNRIGRRIDLVVAKILAVTGVFELHL